MKKALWIWVTVFALSALAAPSSGLAQEEPGGEAGSEGEPGTGGDARTDKDAGTKEEPVEAASEAKRVVRIRRVIELDTERLRWLRSELRSRTQWFERLAAEMAELARERNERKEKLEALEAKPQADRKELAALRAELDELQEDYALFDTQTDLALKGEKTVQKQIQALEEKIAREKRALGELTGEIEIELAEEPAAEVAEPAEPTKAAKPVPIPVPVPAPGAPPQPKDTKASSAMTAAQLQANKVLERKEREVRLAEVALSEFVDRKRALQRQIEFEENLAETGAKEIENLEHALEAFQERLGKYRETGAPPKKIERLERGTQAITREIEELKQSNEARAEYIETLLKRVADLDEAELGVTANVDAAQEEAEKARRRVMWLESPIHPQNIAHWAKERGPRMLLVIAAALLLLGFVQVSARGIARAVVRRRRDDRGAGTGRADTLAFSFRSVSRVLIIVFGVLLVLQEAGIDIKTVLGGAAIIGVAIAFGAQDLMKDYFSGLLILMEDQYQLGDLVTIGGITGTVESVNMRVTVLRDLEGRVHFIPNGNIDHVTNRTYSWGRPVFEVPVGFAEDADRVMEALVEVAKELGRDPDWKGTTIGDPEMLGVDKFTDYGMVIKFMVKTQPDKLFPVRREMLRRITKRFNELGIQITVPHRMIVRDETETEG